MTYECPHCGDFLEGGECPTCGWDKWDRDGDRRLLADGGYVIPPDVFFRDVEIHHVLELDETPIERRRCEFVTVEDGGACHAEAERLIVWEHPEWPHPKNGLACRRDADVFLEEAGYERELVADGGETWDVEEHLEEALDVSDDLEVRYHVRAALQHLALREGRVGWRGTFGPRNGGVVD